jgi:hypothetical protein
MLSLLVEADRYYVIWAAEGNCSTTADLSCGNLALNQSVEIMPRYFFNTRIGNDLIADPEGEELRDPDHAWEVARAMIRQLLREGGGEQNLLSARLEVTDQAGEVVLEFPFSEAIVAGEDEPPTTH